MRTCQRILSEIDLKIKKRRMHEPCDKGCDRKYLKNQYLPHYGGLVEKRLGSRTTLLTRTSKKLFSGISESSSRSRQNIP